jgi:hypothetical protein
LKLPNHVDIDAVVSSVDPLLVSILVSSDASSAPWPADYDLGEDDEVFVVPHLVWTRWDARKHTKEG